MFALEPVSLVDSRDLLLHLLLLITLAPTFDSLLAISYLPPKMETTKFPRRPTMRWDPYKRQVLCCLYRFFACNKKQTEAIFSYIFRSHLNQRGIQGFIPFATLNTQWIWMRNKRDPVWFCVHINTAFDTGGEWKEIITKVKSAAKILRFELHEKMKDDTHTSRWGPLVSSAERNIASVS